jgi:hypothetical protein
MKTLYELNSSARNWTYGVDEAQVVNLTLE